MLTHVAQLDGQAETKDIKLYLYLYWVNDIIFVSSLHVYSNIHSHGSTIQFGIPI